MAGWETGLSPDLTIDSRKYLGTRASTTSLVISSEKRVRTMLAGTLPLRNPGTRACLEYCWTIASRCWATTSAGISTEVVDQQREAIVQQYRSEERRVG